MQHLPIHYDCSTFGEMDSYHFREGSHYKLYNKLGSHFMERDGRAGIYFGVWAPNAKVVSLMADFNNFDKNAHPMRLRNDDSGVWECFIEGAHDGSKYKYWLESADGNYSEEKSDPYAFLWEIPPLSATRVWSLEYSWDDDKWMKDRSEKNSIHSPISVYEVHLGSWKRVPEEDGRNLAYREMAHELADYVKNMGFTHVEFLPVTEHPYDGSWGYQVLGYFAPTSRFGTPQDFMYLVETLHQSGIGVILDWVPSHFAVDMHGLARFDGTNLYEHTDPKQGFHPEWGSCIFNLGRNEVVSFLISSALFWLEKYHIDGIRVDGVASMLYLNYARKDGDWIANEYGGNENLESVKFLQTLNHNVYANFPDVMMIAEESTNWPMVTKPTYSGGLGFEFKWSMGWMHDTLGYLSRDPLLRKHHHEQITFSIWYSFDEQYMLCLSHDEVVHMKGSLIGKMNGDYWQKFANLRLLYAYMFAHPGKKLLFMGGEIGQFSEWDYNGSVDWHLLDYPTHAGIGELVKELNILYRSHPALFANDHVHAGFSWVEANDGDNSVLAFLRFGNCKEDAILVVCNFTPVPRYGYRVGVPFECFWKEVFNSDSQRYGGSNIGNLGGRNSETVPSHSLECSLSLVLPPLGVIWLKPILP